MQDIKLLESENFQVLKDLGHGTSGIVFLAHRQEVGLVAAKVVSNSKFDKVEWDAAGILNKDPPETCPYIVRNILAKQFEKSTVILLEYANLGTLYDLIQTGNEIPLTVIRTIMKQLLTGLNYIHSKGIIHRDIKGGNIMLHSPLGSGRVNCKIADFGVVKIKKDLQQSTLLSFAGTPAYMAPEVFITGGIQKGTGDYEVDVWSLGMLLFILNEVLIRPASIQDDTLWNLLTLMLSFDRKNRISIAQIFEHPFFTSEYAMTEISVKQRKLAQSAQIAQQNGDLNITSFDMDPSYIFPFKELKKIHDRNKPEIE
ncbi:MAG: putative AGC family protein kinase, partial [Streblomastix strix]